MAAENCDLHEMCTENLQLFLKTFLRNLEVRTMPKLVAFFVFAGMEFFISLSISSKEKRMRERKKERKNKLGKSTL